MKLESPVTILRDWHVVSFPALLVILFVFLLPLSSPATGAWTYQVTWGDGQFTAYSYATSPWNDCLLESQRDTLLCDHDHDYDEIRTRMTYDPELLEYLSVRCLAQTYHPAHQKWCFCKGSPSLFASTSSMLDQNSEESESDLEPSSYPPSPPSQTPSNISFQDNSETDSFLPTSSAPSSFSSTLSLSSSSEEETKSYTLCQLYRLYPQMFKGLNSLEVLDLSNNWIMSIHEQTFLNLTSLKVLSLRNNPLSQLKNVDLCLPPNLQILDLSFSQLGEFPATSLHNCPVNTDYKSNSLTYLDLSSSRIREFPVRACWYFGNLKLLNMSRNRIRTLPENPFIGSYNLTALDLSHNHLQELSETFCEGLSSLKRLILSNNVLQAVDAEALRLCGKLQSLDVSVNTLERLDNLPFRSPYLEVFNASGNRLREINTTLFATDSIIKVLDLSYNNLHVLSELTLTTATHVTTLFLHHNALRQSDARLDDVTRNCVDLTHLDISHNHFTELEAGLLSHLAHLKQLFINSNLIHSVHPEAFRGLVALLKVSLASNLLQGVEDGTFSYLPTLQSLNLSGNAMNENRTSLRNISSLETLDLSCNRFTQVPPLEMPSLTVLNLANNFISSLHNDDFSGLSNITRLDLSHNEVVHLDPGVFTDLASLSTLNLAYNTMTWLPDNIISDLIGLKFLDISYNHLYTISHLVLPTSLTDLLVNQNRIESINGGINVQDKPGLQLSIISLNQCGIKHISSDAFKNLIYLREVDLGDNNMTEFPQFEGHPGITYNLSGNPLVCSCHMAWLTTLFESPADTDIHSNYVIDPCVLPPRHQLVEAKSLNRQNFLCRVSLNCPLNCSCFAQEVNAEPEIVMCNGRNLSSIPDNLPVNARVIALDGNNFGQLENMTEDLVTWEELYLNASGIHNISAVFYDNISSLFLLDISDNFLSNVERNWFDDLRNLSILNLGHNRIEVLPAEFVHQSIRVLNLSSNRLQYLPDESLNALLNLRRLEEIYLGDNEWICDCQNRAFVEWIKDQYEDGRRPEQGERSAKGRSTDIENVSARGLDLVKCGNILLVNFDLDQLDCDGHGYRRKIIILVLCILFFFICCLASFCFYHRTLLAAILYYRFRLVLKKSPMLHTQELELYGQFDITVVCDHTDNKIQWWVESILIPKLRHPKWRFSVKYPRQPAVQLAEGHMDMTVHNINRSRCSLMVITSGFGRSHQCLACFQKALQRRRAGLHSIVLLTWGHITVEVMNSGLRPFIKKGLYLPITARLFWERLFYQLPLPRHELVTDCYNNQSHSHQLREIVEGEQKRSAHKTCQQAQAEQVNSQAHRKFQRQKNGHGHFRPHRTRV